MKPSPIGFGSDPGTPLRGSTLRQCAALLGILGMVLLPGLAVWPPAFPVNRPVEV